MSTFDRRPSVTGHWPPLPTEDELTVPRLSKDGHVEGWCRRPADGVWRPADLFWLPPSATKSTDIDDIGHVVGVNDFGGIGDHAWVTAQLNKRERYLDLIRERVRQGAYRLTAQLAKFLGMDDDSAELKPRTGTGTVAYKSLHHAEVARTVAQGRRLAGLAGLEIDRDTGLPIVRRQA